MIGLSHFCTRNSAARSLARTHSRNASIARFAGRADLVTLFLSRHEWTLAGVLLAAALIWQARLGARTHDVAD